MFGPTHIITFIRQFSKSFIMFEISFILILVMAYLAFLYAFSPVLALRPRKAIKLFPDIPKYILGAEDVIIILSKLTKFNDMSEVMYLSLPLISSVS